MAPPCGRWRICLQSSRLFVSQTTTSFTQERLQVASTFFHPVTAPYVTLRDVCEGHDNIITSIECTAEGHVFSTQRTSWHGQAHESSIRQWAEHDCTLEKETFVDGDGAYVFCAPGGQPLFGTSQSVVGR